MPEPMPLISQGVPAYTNDDSSGSFPASNANDTNYHGTWRCAAAPTGNANSGTLCQSPGFTVPFPVYLAYDLSGVPLYQRRQIVVIWYSDCLPNAPWNPTIAGTAYSNVPRDYTIDINAAPGGSLPTSGWVTMATESGQPYHSRQYTFNMAGYNWIRINITGINGGAANNNAAINMDIHDAHLGLQDDWIFYGDSISQRAFEHDDSSGIGSIMPVQIHSSKSLFYPLWEDASMQFYTSSDWVNWPMPSALSLFPGKYAGMCIGTNNANDGAGAITVFPSDIQSIITSIANAGKIAVIPHIPWGNTANILANGPTINGYIDTAIANNPGVAIAGPDLWTYFSNNQTLISGDGIHPVDPNGYAAYRTQWVNWATANVYNLKQINTDTESTYKVRSILNTTTESTYKVRAKLSTVFHSTFKIQVSPNLPSPLLVNGVVSSPFARPLSTVTSTATVINDNNVLQDGLTATCTITFPDNSTQAGNVYALGSGQYEMIYTTKGAGTITELWTFTSSVGSVGKYQHEFPCYYENNP